MWQSLHNKEQTKILPSLMELFPLLSRAIKSHFLSQVLSLLQITAEHITNKLCRYYLCLSGAPRRQQRWNYRDLLHSSNTDIKCFIISQLVDAATAEAVAICDIKMFINLMRCYWNNRSIKSLWSSQLISQEWH